MKIKDNFHKQICAYGPKFADFDERDGIYMEYAIETNHLVKSYGSFNALNDLSIHVPAGKVYGFLGKNGSGKTTTIRIIMGLVNANQGTVKIFGDDISKERNKAIQKIGAIVETPGAYDNLSAAENLMITARMHKTPKERVDEVLALVGLSDVGNKRVGKFSLGMKQRLEIANSLIHSPRIIILDEPTNGLDPEGIKEMRKIIRNLSESFEISVLVSSHLLSEIEQIADYVGIVHCGKLLQEVEVSSFQEDEQSFVLLETDRTHETVELLKSMKMMYEIEKSAIRVFCKKCENKDINAQLVSKGISVFNLSSTAKTLEEKFLTLTGENNYPKGAQI